jgi:predicted nucleotidyltransferase
MEKLKELLKEDTKKNVELNLLNSKVKPENRVNEIMNNLNQIAQLIYKMINLYEDGIRNLQC